MITDSVPKRKARKQEYLLSDGLGALTLPAKKQLLEPAKSLEAALAIESQADVQKFCNKLAAIVSDAHGVTAPPVTVLGVRPHRVSEGVCIYEKFGDYDLNTSLIRLWMRTAMIQKVTSYGTLLSTLCHELCHHLDVVQLGFPNTFHTRGFYERAALLYHHARNTPLRKLVWVEQNDGTFHVIGPKLWLKAEHQKARDNQQTLLYSSMQSKP